MIDLNKAAARAFQLLAEKYREEVGVHLLLARAQNEQTVFAERQAALRLLGALAGEALVGPRIVHLDIVGECDSNCIYCRDHSPYIRHRELWRYQEMPFELATRLIEEAIELGAELMPIVGAGENLLYTKFFELISLLKTKSFAFEIYSNGLSWTDRHIDLLVDAVNAKITFSLSAATAATWAAFRPEMSPEWFNKIEATIRLLSAKRGKGLRLGIVHVLNRLNVKEVLPMIHQAIDLGVQEVQYKLTEINEAAEPIKLRPEEVASIRLEMLEARRLAALAGVEIHDNIETQLDRLDPVTGLYAKNLYDQQPCFAGFEMIRVRRDGAISFCCGLKFIGNAHVQSLAEHWFSPAMQEARRTALALPSGANMHLPDNSPLRDEQCDYCYNYILNDAYIRQATAAGIEHLWRERE